MKKLLVLLALVFVLFSLSACDVNINVQESTTATTQTTTTQKQTVKKQKKTQKQTKKSVTTRATQQVVTQKAPVVSAPKTTTTSAPKTSSIISKDRAKQIALSHAGVSASDIFDYDIEIDRDDGALVYEISFETKQREYEYDILATTGKILKSHSERQDRD